MVGLKNVIKYDHVKFFFFFWIKLATYRYLTQKWTLQLQNFFRVIRFKDWLCEHPRSFHCQILRCHFWLKLDLEESCYIELCLKYSKTVDTFSKLRYYINVDILIMPYYSIIYPFLTYEIQVCGLTYPTYLKPVTTLQKRVVRIMTFSNPRSYSEPLLKSLRLLKFSDIIRFKNFFLYISGTIN